MSAQWISMAHLRPQRHLDGKWLHRDMQVYVLVCDMCCNMYGWLMSSFFICILGLLRQVEII